MKWIEIGGRNNLGNNPTLQQVGKGGNKIRQAKIGRIKQLFREID